MNNTQFTYTSHLRGHVVLVSRGVSGHVVLRHVVFYAHIDKLSKRKRINYYMDDWNLTPRYFNFKDLKS